MMDAVKPGMTDVPPWLADAVEDAKLAFERSRGNLHQQICAAIAAFLRETPNVSVMQARAPGQWHTTRTLAAAIERLGAPEKPDAP